MKSLLDNRPIIVVLAGPNGAGKSTFFEAHIRPTGLRFVNADILARGLTISAYKAADLADTLRRQLLESRESFTFETVFSDPAGAKLAFLREAVLAGYTVLLCFIGLSSPVLSEERVAMRVSQGGHDVPTEKLESRFPRTLANLRDAIRELPDVWVFDNSDLREPFRKTAEFKNGQATFLAEPLPTWLVPLLPSADTPIRG